MKYIVIGGGMSGLAISSILQNRNNEVFLFERDSRVGGMIKCDVVEGNLFHRTGGHVFNTKRKDVLNWFWKHFDKDTEFTKSLRNAVVAMDNGKMIPYPIENHAYMFDELTLKNFIDDLIGIARQENVEPNNFEEFLKGRFGNTLYEAYFQPYNYKVWRRDLTNVPLSWLEGKLPMPTVQEMIYNNINHVEERDFVHSSFYYPKQGGSQFLSDRLSQGLKIIFNKEINHISKSDGKWMVEGIMADRVIFCGNIKQLPSLLGDEIDIQHFISEIANLESHGTTSVFCEMDKNPYSWIYQPSKHHQSHRIICTGNFAESNNVSGKMTGTIEFTDAVSKEKIVENLRNMPYNPRYLTHHYEEYTYPIQQQSTRDMICNLKKVMEPCGIYLLGRFAEWEYYNMDVAIGAALDLSERL